MRTKPQTLSVPGTPEGVRTGVDALDEWAVREAVPDSLRRRLLTAMDEVLSNVVRHGLAGQPGSVDLSFEQDGGQVVLEVADEAPEFNPLLAPPPDTRAPLQQRTQGGLGIALVRALADDLGYQRRDGRNVVTMMWRVEP